MENKCNFKYGEILEFSNKEDFEDPYTGKFLAYHPREQDGECYVDFETDVWKCARRPLPKLKDCQPIVTMDGGVERLRFFSHFNKEGNVEVYVDGYRGTSMTIPVKKYELLENYNYDAD